MRTRRPQRGESPRRRYRIAAVPARVEAFAAHGVTRAACTRRVAGRRRPVSAPVPAPSRTQDATASHPAVSLLAPAGRDPSSAPPLAETANPESRVLMNAGKAPPAVVRPVRRPANFGSESPPAAPRAELVHVGPGFLTAQPGTDAAPSKPRKRGAVVAVDEMRMASLMQDAHGAARLAVARR
jgi:hypothetical protein